MRASFFALFAFGLCFSINAQDIHIYYDVYKDSISYKSNGAIVEHPMLKKGSDIILHVTNYNDYLYELEVSTDEENYSKPSAGLESLLLGGGMGGLTQFQNLLTPLGGVEDMFDLGNPEGDGTMGFGGESSQQVLTSEMKALHADFSEALVEIKDIRGELQDINEGLQIEVERQQYNAFMKAEVMKLKTNANLSPESIKALTMEYLNKILDIGNNGDFDLDDLFDQANVRKTFGRKLDNYTREVSKMSAEFGKLNTLAQDIQRLAFPEDYQANVAATVVGVQSETEQLTERVSQLQALLPNLEAQSVESLATLRYLHEEMKDHRFEKKIIISPDSDITTLNIVMKPLDSLSQNLAVKTLSPVKVKSFGGLKVNASVGVSFTSFFDRPQNYLVREGILYGDDLDAFLPVITSFVHFYQESKKQSSLGGTLGIGLGLGGESSGLQNYFMGASLIIGKGQRIVVSTGLMGGRVTRLAQGFEVGDAYTDLLVPTKTVYDLGFFLGVSFNILGN